MICGLVSIVLVPAIRKDGGPAIFAQTRIGKNGRHFTFYKFTFYKFTIDHIEIYYKYSDDMSKSCILIT